ncbi:MAG: heavy metal-associated domain-containing protein [Anaerolineaceae bacterium]
MSKTLELEITGMTCDHCVHAITTAVKDVAGVTDAEVSLEDRSAVISGGAFDVQAVLDAIEEEGYSATLK